MLGPAKILFALWVAQARVRVPLVVTGLPLTVNSPGALNATEVTVPVPPGRSAATMARKLGVPLEPFGEAKNLFCVCDVQESAIVPEVVIGDPPTVISVGAVTAMLVTVPVPAGRSFVTKALKAGAAAAPVVGPAQTVLAVWVASVTVKVPLVVMGEPLTEKIPGIDKATLVT